MKTMNYFATIVLVLLIGACTDDNNTPEEDLKAVSYKGSEASEAEMSELHLHQYYLEGQIIYLTAAKEELIAQIEDGDESKIAELEDVLRDLEESNELFNINEELMVSLRLPRPPRPMPNPCGDPKQPLNCPAAHFSAGELHLLVAEPSGDVNAIVEDTEGNAIGEANSIEEHHELEGVLVHTFELTVEEGLLVVSKQNPINGEELSYTIHFVVE